jgi:hypothetical protein
MDFWLKTVDRGAWRTDDQVPTVVLIWRREIKIKDAKIFAQALNLGELLRIVSDRPMQEQEIGAICANSGLLLASTTEDRELTLAGCYRHCYTEFLRSSAAGR